MGWQLSKKNISKSGRPTNHSAEMEITQTTTTQPKTGISMGLDMDLYAVTYLDNFESSPPEQKAAFLTATAAVGIAPFTSHDSIPHIAVRLHVADWKNAYQIHRWIVDHVQDGEDTRQETAVVREQLQELVALCKHLLKKKDCEQAAKLLPPVAGLFKTKEAREHYWEESYWWDLDSTLRQLVPLLSNPKLAKWEFYYHATW